MWLWRRTRQPDRAVAGSGERPAAPVAAPAPEWPTLPPIQRSVHPMRPVSPQQDFGDSLLSWRNPSFLAPLGHFVSADAPAGVIHQLIEPAASSATSPAGPALELAAPPSPRPSRAGVVQRMLAAVSPWVSRESAPTSPRSDGDLSGASAEPLPTATPADHPGVSPVSRAVPATPVQRSAAGVTPMTRVPDPDLPMLELPVTAVTPSRTAPMTQTAPEPAGTAAPVPSAAPVVPVDSEVGQAPTLGMSSSSAATPPADGSVVGSGDGSGQDPYAGAPAVETAGVSAQADPIVARSVDPLATAMERTVTTRRLGLGPPLTSDAVTAQRSPAPPVATPPLVAAPSPTPDPPGSLRAQIAPLLGQPSLLPVPRDVVPVLGESGPRESSPADSSDSSPGESSPGESSPGTLTGAADLRPVGLPLPVLRVHHSTGPRPAQPPGPLVAAGPVVARLIGDRIPPLLTALSVTPPPVDSRRQPQQDEPVPLQRIPAQHPIAGNGQAREGAGGRFISIQPARTAPTVAAEPTVAVEPTVGAGYPHAAPAPLPVQLMPLAGQPTRTAQARPWPGPVVQAARPVPASAGAVRSEPPPVVSPAQDVAPAAGVDLPVQLDSGGVAPTVSRAEDPAAGAPAAEVPLTEVPPAEVPPPEVPPAEVPAAGAPTAGGAPAAGAVAGAANPDELVKKLFDPLLRRLKTELRLDRERRGVLTDLRH